MSLVAQYQRERSEPIKAEEFLRYERGRFLATESEDKEIL
jgi:hypothetical protein